MIPVIWILEIDLLKQRVDPTQPPRVNGTVQSQENIPGVSFFSTRSSCSFKEHWPNNVLEYSVECRARKRNEIIVSKKACSVRYFSNRLCKG